ncbi:MAG: VWA domain-containing protein [Candidatus Aminicenantes bacterium]|nr:VWA domain-containing protein [Candidatus Aminicenantes bacterium]
MRKKTYLAIFLLPALVAGSASQQNPAQKILRHDAAVVVKLVPVRVLDRNGRPVTDLKVDDFVLYDNKELKKITEFEIHGLEGFGAAPDKTGTIVGPTRLKETNRKYFVLLDFQGSDAAGVTNAKKAAEQFIETKLQPGDEVAVLYYTGLTGLNMTQYLTSDKKKMKKGIDRAQGFPGVSGTTSYSGVKSAYLPPSETKMPVQVDDRPKNISGSGETNLPEVYTTKTEQIFAEGSINVGGPPVEARARNAQEFSKSMSELAKAMEYIAGSKNLLLFSSQAINKTVGLEFAASNTPAFTINTKNWIEGMFGTKRKYTYTEHPLKDFSLASGGQYFADIKEVTTIAEDVQMLSGNYYVLGYYINEQWDGQFHQIQVDVKKPDYRVFVQGGYNNPKPFDQWTDLEKQIQLYDLAFADQPIAKETLDAPVDPLFSEDGKGSNGLLLSKFQVDAKTGIPPDKAELFTFIFDKDNKVVQALRGEIDLTTHAQKTLYPYAMASLKPGEYELRFVARDMTTGQALMGKSALIIPGLDRSGTIFYSPLLLVPGQEAQFVQMSPPKRVSQRSSFINFYPLLPLHCRPLVKTLGPNDKRLIAVIPAEFQAKTAPAVHVGFRLTAASTGEEFPLETRILETKKFEKGKSVLVVEIDLPILSPGEYQIEIVATDKTTQARAVMKTSFRKQ